MSLDESIVVELNFGMHLIIILLSLWISCQILPTYIPKIKNENPSASFFTGDFNGGSQFWWPDGDTTPEGREIENLLTSLGFSQLISEPMNFEPNRNPSCIDLVTTDRANLVLDSGTRTSLDFFCHHQIIYCKVNFNSSSPAF